MGYPPFIPVIEEEEPVPSSLWKISKESWKDAESRILKDAEERGYSNPRFVENALKYDRDSWFSSDAFMVLLVLMFFLWFVFGCYRGIVTGRFDSFESFIIGTFILAGVSSFLLSIFYCHFSKVLTVDWLTIATTSNYILIEVFNDDKLWRIQYAEKIGLEPTPTATLTMKHLTKCEYCGSRIDQAMSRCPNCGGIIK